ncbi:MAG TPA: caspase family protein [Pyrinomonadaceae bacterium]|nr:caspase family protein [Pyrinomonadaceae bacterium]
MSLNLRLGITTVLFITVLVSVPAVQSAAHSAQDNRQLQRDHPQPNGFTGHRLALVIGNGAYDNVSRLKNPPNDAAAVALVLHELGFEVTSDTNKTQREMKQMIRAFGLALRANGGVGVFYFAGHGVQAKGRNYLMPVDVDIQAEADLEDQAVDLNYLLNLLEEAQNALNIVILDACRNNPYTLTVRSTQGGLMQLKAPSGTLVSYATAPDKTAEDGAGKNSPFTEELIKQMNFADVLVETMFRRVTEQVSLRTHGKQEPWFSANLKGDFYFRVNPERPADSTGSKGTESPSSSAGDKKKEKATELNRRGVEYFDARKFGEAAAAFAEACELSPYEAQFLRNLGETLIYVDKSEEAVKHLEQAVLLDPTNAKGQALLGRAQVFLKQYEDAVLHLEEALKLDRDSFDAHEAMWAYYDDLEQDERAREEAEAMRRINSESSMACHHLGTTYHNLGKYQESISMFKEALRLQPDFYSFYTWIVTAYLNLGRPNEARKVAADVQKLSQYWAKQLYDLIEAGPSPSRSPNPLRVKVPANQNWTSSGLTVRCGQRINITASGRILLGNRTDSEPNGVTGVFDAANLMPDRPTGALIAVIGDSDNYLLVGNNGDFEVNRDGELFLTINDKKPETNSGSFEVVIRRTNRVINARCEVSVK